MKSELQEFETILFRDLGRTVPSMTQLCVVDNRIVNIIVTGIVANSRGRHKSDVLSIPVERFRDIKRLTEYCLSTVKSFAFSLTTSRSQIADEWFRRTAQKLVNDSEA